MWSTSFSCLNAQSMSRFQYGTRGKNLFKIKIHFTFKISYFLLFASKLIFKNIYKKFKIFFSFSIWYASKSLKFQKTKIKKYQICTPETNLCIGTALHYMSTHFMYHILYKSLYKWTSWTYGSAYWVTSNVISAETITLVFYYLFRQNVVSSFYSCST